jgi:hypothetical protein
MATDSQFNRSGSPRKLLARSIASEVALAIIFLAISAAFTYHAMIEARQGKPIFIVIDTLGFASILLGLCFDPVNFAALLLPWIWQNVAVSTPFRKVGWFFICIGYIMLAAAWGERHGFI